MADFIVREETFLAEARAKGSTPAASGVLEASVVAGSQESVPTCPSDPPVLSVALLWKGAFLSLGSLPPSCISCNSLMCIYFQERAGQRNRESDLKQAPRRER